MVVLRPRGVGGAMSAGDGAERTMDWLLGP